MHLIGYITHLLLVLIEVRHVTLRIVLLPRHHGEMLLWLRRVAAKITSVLVHVDSTFGKKFRIFDRIVLILNESIGTVWHSAAHAFKTVHGISKLIMKLLTIMERWLLVLLLNEYILMLYLLWFLLLLLLLRCTSKMLCLSCLKLCLD